MGKDCKNAIDSKIINQTWAQSPVYMFKQPQNGKQDKEKQAQKFHNWLPTCISSCLHVQTTGKGKG